MNNRGRWLRHTRQPVVDDRLALRANVIGRVLSSGMARACLTWKTAGNSPARASVEVTIAAEDPDWPRVELHYAIKRADGWRTIAQTVAMCRTAQWRGNRLWFQCPECGKRCGVLYLGQTDSAFRCRGCAGLIYRCQRYPALPKSRSKPPGSGNADGEAQHGTRQAVLDLIETMHMRRPPDDRKSRRPISSRKTHCPGPGPEGKAAAMRSNAHETPRSGPSGSRSSDAWRQSQADLGNHAGAENYHQHQSPVYDAAYEAMARPDRVDYIEHGLQLLDDGQLPSKARIAVAEELLLRMVTDLNVPATTFEVYLAEIRPLCAEGFSACAKRFFQQGQLSVALIMGRPTFLRMARIVELHLQLELGLRRTQHLLMLDEAMQAWAQSRILRHAAMALREGDNILFDVLKVEARYRSQADAQQRIFLRLWRQLEKAAAKDAGRAV